MRSCCWNVTHVSFPDPSTSSAVLLFPRLMQKMFLFGRIADVFVLIFGQECFKRVSCFLKASYYCLWLSVPLLILRQAFSLRPSGLLTVLRLYSLSPVRKGLRKWPNIDTWSEMISLNGIKPLKSCWNRMWGQRAYNSTLDTWQNQHYERELNDMQSLYDLEKY